MACNRPPGSGVGSNGASSASTESGGLRRLVTNERTAAVMGPTVLWYLTRGTGVVTLILLTVSVALGVANARGLKLKMCRGSC